MGLTIKTLACNASCQNCYENPIRKNYQEKFNIRKVIDTLNTQMPGFKNNPTIHGGEPLLIKTSHLRKLFAIIYDKYKSTGVQTNLLNLTTQHINLFKKFDTHVGISLDGDTKYMNSSRGYDPVPVIENMKLLRSKEIKMSLIVVLWNSNTVDTKFFRFIDSMIRDFGIMDIRINPGISFTGKNEIHTSKLGMVYGKLADYCISNPEYCIQPIRDIIDLLMGHYDQTCIFGECDPYHTGAETPIFFDGTLGNCLKSGSSIDGITSMRANRIENERYKILKQIPQDQGGCLDCEWWNICKGGCPGEGINNDWRNRSRFCDGWKTTYHYLANKIKGLFPNIYLANEVKYLMTDTISRSTWKKDKRDSLNDLKEIEQGRIPALNTNRDHQDKHGDKPHGDHTDRGGRRK